MIWKDFAATTAIEAEGRAKAIPTMAAIAVGFAVILALNLGLRVGLAWGGPMVAVEAWLLLGSTHALSKTPTPLKTINWLIPMAASEAGWALLGLLFWLSGSPALAAAALALWLGHVAFAASVSHAAKFALACSIASVTTCVAAGFVISPHYSGAGLIALLAGLALAAMMVGMSVSRSLKAKRDLDETTRRLAAANEAKSEFLAMMSHELRTPLNGVLGMARALANTKLDDRQLGYVKTVLQSGDSLLTVLNDTLDHSKIEAGKLDIEEIDFDLHDVVLGVHALWEDAARRKNLALECEISESTPRWVRGDASRVRQIVSNLVSNALKFTPSGFVRIALEGELSDGPLTPVRIAVIDSGPGISDEVQAKLFQPFTQADASTARTHGGTGLGLSISRRLAELMGGSIDLASAPGQGATFSLQLPLLRRDAPPETELGCDADLTGLRILAAEDNPTNRAVLSALFDAVDLQPVMAEDGQVALELLQGAAFDVVLMDVHMPRLDGKEALRRIRAGEAGRPDIPVIALTADAMNDQRELLLKLGFNGHVAKPIMPQVLFEAIAAAVAGSSAAEDDRQGAAA